MDNVIINWAVILAVFIFYLISGKTVILRWDPFYFVLITLVNAVLLCIYMFPLNKNAKGSNRTNE